MSRIKLNAYGRFLLIVNIAAMLMCALMVLTHLMFSNYFWVAFFTVMGVLITNDYIHITRQIKAIRKLYDK